jgi:hypothetical protein
MLCNFSFSINYSMLKLIITIDEDPTSAPSMNVLFPMAVAFTDPAPLPAD